MQWSPVFPSQAQLRLETQAMRQSILEAILATVAPSNLIGVYAKGSSLKAWDSLLDYVPELSDVDIHLLLQDDTPLENLGTALKFSQQIEDRFRAKVPQPLHLPRPQIQLIRSRLSGYSPSFGVQALYGLDYTELLPQFGQSINAEQDRQSLLEPEHFLKGLFDSVQDRYGRYLWDVLRQLAWRVGPTGSRMLSVLGASPQVAWDCNRTQVYSRLQAAGQAEAAEAYQRFYVQAWEVFVSSYQNTNAAREAVAAGAVVLELGLELAKKPSATVSSTFQG